MAERKKTNSKTAEKARRDLEKEQAIKRNQRKRHIYSVLLFVIGLLVMAFSVVSLSDTGPAWYAIHRFLRGVFGLSVFVIGPVLIYASVMLAKTVHKSALVVKMLQLTVMILLASGAVQVIAVGEVVGIGEMYRAGQELSGGGVVGMILGFPLSLFGRVGGSIIVLLILFVFIMLMGNITVDAFLKLVVKPFKKAHSFAKQQHALHKQEAEYLAEAREETAKQAETDMAYAKMKAAEQKIEEEIGGKAKLGEIEAVIESDVSDVPEVPNKSDVTNESESDAIDESDIITDSKTLDLPTPPVYIAPDENSDEPPFDIESVDNPAVVALDELQKQEGLESTEKEQLESSVIASVSGTATDSEVGSVTETSDDIESKPKSDFERLNALAAFAAHQQLYSLPGVDLLDEVVKKRTESDVESELEANSIKLVETLKSFGVLTKIVGVVRGPSVTRYEIQPAPGVKISKITNLTDDIALNLAAAGVRMEAPIPGKSAVGVEVPNTIRDMVAFRELIDSDEFRKAGESSGNGDDGKLATVIGRDITGEIIISDIAKMPHILIAGTTGSGKSVCVNSIIMSILYRATPDEVRLMMIDPKMVEFAIYSGIPHLLTPVVTDPKKAAGALGWAVNEMTRRYSLFAENNVRNIGEFNQKVKNTKSDVAFTDTKRGDISDEDLLLNEEQKPELEFMAKIIIFIDELADLMMTAAKEVEGNICRLAQLARAAGIHLVIATQRPTTNVVTGLIKANIPSRIGLKVASQVDSRVIFDTAGAEKLLGNGDMLYAPTGSPKPIRVQGCWVANEEINRVVKFVKDNFDFSYDTDVIEEIERHTAALDEKDSKGGDAIEEFEMSDDKLEDAIEAVIDAGKASTSYLQLKLKLGYGRAARIMDIMERMGVIGKSTGASKPREVLMTRQDWLERKLHQNE
ncbi:MAG: DNA translocase FtsK [Oscillospiraceae bacterium]|nr:DNA translocase FtsK [Oscillospiraceae bacterium]